METIEVKVPYVFFIVMRCAIWYHLHNLKNVKNTHGGVLLLDECYHYTLGFLLVIFQKLCHIEVI